jgi:predicted phosphoribosyltransferase
VAALVASHLGVPLEILIVRKLGVPGNPELAMGAIAEGGAETLNEDVIRWIPHPLESLAGARGRECEELRRRAALYRGDRPPLDLRTRHVLIVDDGAATGATAITYLLQLYSPPEPRA